MDSEAEARRELGKKGEEVAAEFLEGKGFTVLARNYLKKWGEIDIVARRGNKLRFVEVKAVSRDLSGVSRENVSRLNPGRKPGSPERSDRFRGGTGEYRAEENVHPWKIKRLHRAIESYLMENSLDNEWQIDVVAVELDLKHKKAKVRFVENVVL